MRCQMSAVYSLPYAPTPAKLDEIGNLVASNNLHQFKTSDRLVKIVKICNDRKQAIEIAQRFGRLVRTTMSAKIEGKVSLREVADESEVMPLLFEQQQKLDLQAPEYRLVFGATCTPSSGGSGSVGLYNGKKRIFSSDDVSLAHCFQINVTQYAALLHGLSETLSYLMFSDIDPETVVLHVVSPCELVIKQCRMGNRGQSEWSVSPDLVEHAARVVEVAKRFKEVKYWLPDEVKR